MNNTPFKRLAKQNKDIILIPKTNKYKYVLIFMHGLFTTPFKYVDYFDRFNGPLQDSFKIILPCASIQKADFNKGRQKLLGLIYLLNMEEPFMRIVLIIVN